MIYFQVKVKIVKKNVMQILSYSAEFDLCKPLLTRVAII